MRTACALLLACMSLGCTTTANRSLPNDAGADADTSVDAGPCGGGCSGATPYCNEATDQCVACLETAQCTDAARPACDTAQGQCVPCTDNAQCSHIAGKGVCDTGTCVQCNKDQYAACGPNVCNNATKECTAFVQRDTAVCGECVADLQCWDGMLCVPTTFNNTSVGSFCLWKQSTTGAGTPDGDCTNESARPYVTPEPLTSVDGVSDTVCRLAVTTCPARNDFSSKPCDAQTDPGHAQCGVEGQNDGYCVQFGTGSNYRCTVPCNNSPDDCPDNNPQCVSVTGITSKVCKL
jgi:hypothetical protein